MNVVVIVAKTRVGRDVCVGGLDSQGASVRLYDTSWRFPPRNTPYQIGQFWDMTLVPKPSPIPPHVEDMAVMSEKYLGQLPHLTAYIRQPSLSC